MTKKDLLEALAKVPDNQEIYIIKDNADVWDRAEFLHATMAHEVDAITDSGALIEVPDEYETEYIKDSIQSVFVIY